MNHPYFNQKFDIVVLGGGLAGCAAARTAAKLGKKVLLVERYGFLGGMATAGKVNPWMRYWVGDYSEENTINRGFFKEINERLRATGDLIDTGCFNDEMLKIVLQEIVEESGVQILYHAFVTDAEASGDAPIKIKSVLLATKGGLQKVSADLFIDATGDADLLEYASVPFFLGREEDALCQPMTTCFRVSNVKDKNGNMFPALNWNELAPFRDKLTALYKEHQSKGEIKNPREDVLCFSNVQPGVIHFNSTRVLKKSVVNPIELSEAEIEGKKQVKELFNWLKNNFIEFKESILTEIGPQIGIRESRRIKGQVVVNAKDLAVCRKFENSIARGNYGIDIHSPSGKGTTIEHIKEGDYYTIPIEACIPENGGNVLVAGRPVSTTHEAHSAVRVMPITSCIGDGVGVVAAVMHDEWEKLNQPESTPTGMIPDMKLVHTIMDKAGMLY